MPKAGKLTPFIAGVVFMTTLVYVDASDNYTVNKGVNSKITAHAECREVTNNSATGASVYVPTQTDPEWESFYTNPPPGVSTSACCAGVLVGGYCWYMGGSSQSCTTVCSSHGGYNAATRSYAGSDGTDARCTAVVNALGYDGSPITRGWTNYGIGCGYHDGAIRYAAPYTTTAGGTASGRQRACACNQ